MENNQQPEFNPLLAAAGLHGQPWGWWAKYQLRSKAKGHKGWWIDMGSANHLAFNDNNGNIIGAAGTYIGPSSLGKDYGRFLIRGVKGIPDGIYHINSSKIVPIQAMISDQDIASLGYDVSHLTPDADEVIDLANTRVDPITETDLLMAASKLEPLGNLAEEAKKRGEMAGATHGDLAEDDIVYDPSTQTYGSVIHVTPDNDKVSTTVRWQGNRITTTTPASKDAPVRVWKAPAKKIPEQEMSGGLQKGRFEGRARDLQPGDVFTNRYGEKVLVTKIKQSGRELDVYYTDPETNKITSSLYNAGDKIQISRGMGEEPGGQKPSAKPVKGTPAQPKLLTSDDVRKLSVGDEIYLKKKGATGVQQFHVNSKGFIEKGVYDPESKATANKLTADELADAIDAGEYESVFAGRIPTNPQAEEKGTSKAKAKAKTEVKSRDANSAGKKIKVKYTTELKHGDVVVDKKDPDVELGIFLGIKTYIDPKTGVEGNVAAFQKIDGSLSSAFSPNSNPISWHVIGSRPEDVSQENLDKLPKDMILSGKKETAKTRKAAKAKPKIVIPEGPIVLPESVVSERTEGKPTQKQLDSILRRIKMGVFQDNRAKEILATLPTASSTEVGKLVNEADEAEALHLMANKLPIDAIRFPKSPGQVRDAAVAYELERAKGKKPATAISGEKGTSGYLGSQLRYDIDEDGNIFIKVLSKQNPDNALFKNIRRSSYWDSGDSSKIQGSQFDWNDSYRDVLDEDGNPKLLKDGKTAYRDMGWARQGEETDTSEDRAEFLSRVYRGFIDQYSKESQALKGSETPTTSKNAEVGSKGKLSDKVKYEILPSGDVALTGYMPNMRQWGDAARAAVDPSEADVKLWILKSKKDEEILAGRATAGDAKAASDLKTYRSGVGKYKKANRNPEWDATSVVIQVNTKKTNVSPDDVRSQVLDALSSYFGQNKKTNVEENKNKLELGTGFTYKIAENGDIVIDGDFDNDDFRKLVKDHIRKGTSELKFNDYVTELTITPFGANDDEKTKERERLLNGIKEIISARAPKEVIEPEKETETPETTETKTDDLDILSALKKLFVEIAQAKEAKELEEKIDISHRDNSGPDISFDIAKEALSRIKGLISSSGVGDLEDFHNYVKSQIESVNGDLSKLNVFDLGRDYIALKLKEKEEEEEKPTDQSKNREAWDEARGLFKKYTDLKKEGKEEEAAKVRKELEKKSPDYGHYLNLTDEISKLSEGGVSPKNAKLVTDLAKVKALYANHIAKGSTNGDFHPSESETQQRFPYNHLISQPEQVVPSTSTEEPEAKDSVSKAKELVDSLPDLRIPENFVPSEHLTRKEITDPKDGKVSIQFDHDEELKAIYKKLTGSDSAQQRLAWHKALGDLEELIKNETDENKLKNLLDTYVQAYKDYARFVELYQSLIGEGTDTHQLTKSALEGGIFTLLDKRSNQINEKFNPKAKDALRKAADDMLKSIKASKPTQEEEKANLYKWLYSAAYNSSIFKGSKDGSWESDSSEVASRNLNDISTKISNFGGLLNKLKKYQEDWETKFPKPSGKDYSDFYSGISNVVDEYSKNPDSKISKQTEAEKAGEKAAKDAEDAKALRKDLEDRAHVGDIQSVKKLTALLLDEGKKDEVRDLLAKHEDSKDTYILTQRGILAAEDGDTEKAKKLLYEALNGLSKKDRIVSPAHRALRDVLKKEKGTPEPKSEPVSNNGMVANPPSTDISGAAGLAFTRTTGDSYHPTEVDFKGNPATIYSPSPGPFSGKPLRAMIEKFKGDYEKIRIALGDSKVISFDTETLGFNAFDGDGQINRVIQWGFVVHNPDGTEERHSFFVRPSDGAKLSEWSRQNLVRPVYDEKGNYTGNTPITDEWLATQPSEEEMLPRILEILSGNPVLVAHNIQFDLPLLHDMINRLNANRSIDDMIELNFAGAIDTMELARYITKTYDAKKGVLEGPSKVIDKSKDHNDPMNRRSSATLPDVLSFLGLKPSGWHTADGDAEDTLRILDGLLRHAAENPNSVPENGYRGVTAFDFDAIDARYEEALAKYEKYTGASAPATRRQSSIAAKDGFADMLRNKYKITDDKTIEDILAPIQKLTRGEAAKYIEDIRHQLDTKGLVDVQSAVADIPEEKPEATPVEEPKQETIIPEGFEEKDFGKLEVGDTLINVKTGTKAKVTAVKNSTTTQKKRVEKEVNGKIVYSEEDVEVELKGFVDIAFVREDGTTGNWLNQKKSGKAYAKKKEAPKPAEPAQPVEPTVAPKTEEKPAVEKPKVLDHIQKIDAHRDSEGVDKLVEDGYAKMVKVGDLKAGDYIFYNNQWQQILGIRQGRVNWERDDDGINKLIQEMDIQVENPIGGYIYKELADKNIPALTPAAFEGGPASVKPEPEEPEKPRPAVVEDKNVPSKEKAEPKKEEKPAKPKAQKRPVTIDLSGFTDEEKALLKDYIDAISAGEELVATNEGGGWTPPNIVGLEGAENIAKNAEDLDSRLQQAMDKVDISEAERKRFYKALDKLNSTDRDNLISDAIDLLNRAYDVAPEFYNKEVERKSKREDRWAARDEKRAIKKLGKTIKKLEKNLTFDDLVRMIESQNKLESVANSKESRREIEKQDSEVTETPAYDPPVVAEVNNINIDDAVELTDERKAFVEAELFEDNGLIPQIAKDFIPDPKNPQEYEEAYQKYIENMGYNENDTSRNWFNLLVKNARKKARSNKKYRMLQVEGTYSHIRWIDGEVNPEALKNIVNEIKKLNDMFGLHDQKINIVLAPTGTFGPRNKYIRQDLSGYSILGESSFSMVINPDLHGNPLNEDNGVKYGPEPIDGLMDATIHEFGHGVAQLLLGQFENGKESHGADYNEFVSLFGHLVGNENQHPISKYGANSDGENLAEFIKAAYLAMQYGDGASSNKEISKFIGFLNSKLEKISINGPTPAAEKNRVPLSLIGEQEMANNRPNFPKKVVRKTKSNVEDEFNSRIPFYEKGLTPYGSKLNPTDNSLIQALYNAVLDYRNINSQSPSSENEHNMHVAMLNLKHAYDSFFFAYASRKPRFNVDSIKDRISQEISPENYTTWSSNKPFIPGGNSDLSTKFGNQIALGKYKADNGDSYHLAYVRTVDLTDPDAPKEKVMVIASNPNQNRDEFFGKNTTLRKLLESSSSTLVIGQRDNDSLEIHGVETKPEEQGQGLATALLAFARMNNKRKIVHSSKPTLSMEAWAHSVDKDPDNHTVPSRFLDRYGITGATQKAEPAIKELEDGTIVWPHHDTPLTVQDYRTLPEMQVDSAHGSSYSPEELSAIKAVSSGISPEILDRALASAFNNEESRLSRSAYLYSGVHAEAGSEVHTLLSNNRPGDVIKIGKKYLTSTTSPTISYEDLGPGALDDESVEDGFMLIIRAPKGSRVIATPKEILTEKAKKEVLLDKGSSFRVVRVRKTERRDANGEVIPNAFNTTLELDLLPGENKGVSLNESEGRKRNYRSEIDAYNIGREYGRNLNPNLIDNRTKSGAGLGPNNSIVGYVSTEKLRSMSGNPADNKEKLQEKLDDITSKRGITHPVTVVYDPISGYGYLWDGNHRVEAAHQNGISHVPTKVLRRKVDPNIHPNAVKLGHDWVDPSLYPANFPVHSHPYFIFDHEDMISGKSSVSDELIQEMVSGLGRVDMSIKNRSDVAKEYKRNENARSALLNPGTYVQDKKTGRVGQVVRFEITQNGSYTGKIEVRYLDGIADALERVTASTTEYDSNGERKVTKGLVDETGNYNDIRAYTEKLHDLGDLTPVTSSFVTSGGGSIFINDTMYGVISGEGIYGRINRFVSPGIVEVAELIGEDEYGGKEYKMHTIKASQFLPIQDRRETQNPQGQAPKHSANMIIDTGTYAQILEVLASLKAYDYIPEDIETALFNSIHNRFVTYSGAQEILKFLTEFDGYRRAQLKSIIREQDKKVQPQKAYAPEEPTEPTQEAKPTKMVSNISDLRAYANHRSLNDGIPLISSEHPTTPASNSDMAAIQRILYESGVVKDSEADEIISKMPKMSQKEAEATLKKLQKALLNKRIANDEPIDGLVVPEGYNLSKLNGYTSTSKLPDDADEADMAGYLDKNMREALEITSGPDGAEKRELVDYIMNNPEYMAIIGKGGVGKSVLLNLLRARLTMANRRYMVLSPTGVAATPIGGVTIHSAFGFDLGVQSTKLLDVDGLGNLEKYQPNGYIGQKLKNLEYILLDEVSMVRPDLIDGMDRALRIAKGINKPFGGVALIMFGDPFQLPPVDLGTFEETEIKEGDNPLLVERKNRDRAAIKEFREKYPSNWFFNAHALTGESFPVKELTTVFRQKNGEFTDALNDVREGKMTKKDQDLLDSRVILERKNLPDGAPTLTLTNDAADLINKERSAQIEGKTHVLSAKLPDIKLTNAEIQRLFAEPEISVKEGDLIMMVKNDNLEQQKRDGIEEKVPNRWSNGTMARLKKVNYDKETGTPSSITVTLVEPDGKDIVRKVNTFDENGEEVTLEYPETYTVYMEKEDQKGLKLTDVFDEDSRTTKKMMKESSQGAYEQFPIRLGYAITVHKAQGKSLVSAIVDFMNPEHVDPGNKKSAYKIDPLTGEVVRKRGTIRAAGQLYVALSRLRSLEGLFLTRKVSLNDVLVDPDVQNWIDKVRTAVELQNKAE